MITSSRSRRPGGHLIMAERYARAAAQLPVVGHLLLITEIRFRERRLPWLKYQV
jgi:hypothetical protein